MPLCHTILLGGCNKPVYVTLGLPVKLAVTAVCVHSGSPSCSNSSCNEKHCISRKHCKATDWLASLTTPDMMITLRYILGVVADVVTSCSCGVEAKDHLFLAKHAGAKHNWRRMSVKYERLATSAQDSTKVCTTILRTLEPHFVYYRYRRCFVCCRSFSSLVIFGPGSRPSTGK